MKHGKTLLSGVLAAAAMAPSLLAVPLGTAFTYQGRLDQNNQPAPNGIYQMTFWLYAASSGGSPLASNTVPSIPVTNGLFATDVDFGAMPTWFTGDERWMAITVRTNNGALPFVLLSPRTRLAPTPNAIFASLAGTVAAGGILTGQLATATAPAPGQILGYNGSSLVWQNAGSTSPFLLNGSSAYYTGGNVGIGTANPLEKLGVQGSISSTIDSDEGGSLNLRNPRKNGAASRAWVLYNMTGVYGDSFQIWNYPGSGVPGDQRFVLKDDGTTILAPIGGNVGIGTGTPAAGMHVKHDGATLALEGVTHAYMSFYPDGAAAGRKGFFGFPDAAANDIVLVNEVPGGQVLVSKPASALGDANQLSITHAGIQSQALGLGYFYNSGVQSAGVIQARDASAGTDLLLNPSGGDVGIGTSNPQAQLDVAGKARVCTLEIYGGCDLAEPFPMKEETTEVGSVVIIDEEHPGRLKLSTRAYDTQVAGIVSGASGINPGIALKQEGALEQGKNVALSGRVYVKADASHGSIKPGDLLTTSDTPGHAMKVTDHAKAQGAILGKAMSSLNEGTGLVLVLVTLQ